MDSSLIQWNIRHDANTICNVNDASTFAYGGYELIQLFVNYLKESSLILKL